jgi:hypothetical protein
MDASEFASLEDTYGPLPAKSWMHFSPDYKQRRLLAWAGLALDPTFAESA